MIARFLIFCLTGRQDPPVNWGFAIVPEKNLFVVERFGRYRKTLPPGMHLLLPGADRIAYVHSLKEALVPIVDPGHHQG